MAQQAFCAQQGQKAREQAGDPSPFVLLKGLFSFSYNIQSLVKTFKNKVSDKEIFSP